MNCPHCQRLLYSLRRETCGYCGGELPAEMRLSEEEIAAQRAEVEVMNRRRAVAKEKEEKEREAARKRSDGSVGGLGF
jgi:hypothetical protein